jgi:hypothetical protein
MQHCWATEPSARPAVGRVLECLQYMIRERQQQAAASSSGAAGGPTPCVASDPLPHLLANPPQRKQIHWWQAPHVRKAALVKGVGSEASASQPANSAPASQVGRMYTGLVTAGGAVGGVSRVVKARDLSCSLNAAWVGSHASCLIWSHCICPAVGSQGSTLMLWHRAAGAPCDVC